MNIFSIKTKKSFVGLTYAFSLILLYHKTITLSFLSDDYKFLALVKQEGLSLIFTNFNDSFFIPLSHILWLLFWSVLGENPIGYNIISLSLHWLNALMIFVLTRKILSELKNKQIQENAFNISFFTGLFFLVSPYQTEAINWFSARSYLLATFFVLLAAYHYIFFAFTKKNRNLYLSLVFYFLGLLSKETAIMFLPTVLFSEVFLRRVILADKIKTSLLILGITVLYFILRLIVLGNWVGGYGANTHLNFDLSLIIQNIIIYTTKFILLYRYLPDILTGFPQILYTVLLGVALMGAIGYFWSLQKNITLNFLKINGIAFLFFLFALISVINLETTSLAVIQSDRYGYLASLPIMFMFAFIIFTLFRKNIAYFLAFGLFVIMSNLTLQTNKVWQKASQLQMQIITEVSENVIAHTVVFLNLPDNYNGVYVFREGFVSSLHFHNPGTRDKTIVFGVLQEYDSIGNIILVNIKNEGLITASMTNPASPFLRINPGIEKETSGKLHFFEHSNQHFTLKSSEDIGSLQVFWYNNGKVHNVLLEN